MFNRQTKLFISKNTKKLYNGINNNNKQILNTKKDIKQLNNNVVSLYNIVSQISLPIPINNKIIALLDFSYSLDINIKDTINFYFNNFSVLYKEFPIINIPFNIERTIEQLNNYYQQATTINLPGQEDYQKFPNNLDPTSIMLGQ